MTTRRTFLTFIAATPAALVLSRPGFAAEPMVFQRKGYAINGYDPVAYFTEKKPVRGSDDFTSDWKGATFRFASAANKAAFDANPEGFAPQYGGYCAYGVANGYVAKTDPDAWTVHQGKLYLNFSKGIRRRYLKDIPGYNAAADQNWPDVLG